MRHTRLQARRRIDAVVLDMDDTLHDPEILDVATLRHAGGGKGSAESARWRPTPRPCFLRAMHDTSLHFPRRIDAVLLDMDGTLHDTEILYVAALRHAVGAVGRTVTEAFCHALIGLPAAEADAVIRAHLGPDIPFTALQEAYAAHLDAALAAGLTLKTGALALVETLARAGIPVAVATSAGRHGATTHLARSGLARHLPVVVTRDDVTRGKPFPDLFLEAARRLGADPAHCVAVEDSHNGIRAAHAAGTMPIMVPDIVPPTDEIRRLCVGIARDLHQIADALLTTLRK